MTDLQNYHNTLLFQFEEAIASICKNSSQICCRRDTYFNAPFDNPGFPTNPFDNRGGPEQPRDCGVRNEEPIGIRISGVQGTRLEPGFGEWPNMCIILQKIMNTEEEYYKCGASLIAPNIVLTAAHCVA